MLEQQKIDHEMIVDFWKVLKEYGDITTDDQDEERWSSMMDATEALRHKYPEARKLFLELEFFLNDRAVRRSSAA